MSERKVINKYIPPDFDPDRILPRGGGNSVRKLGVTSRKAGKTVRVMLPFSIRCDSCQDFVYKGTKFNARKETSSERYLNRVPIYRFYIKCPSCYSDIIYRTDPQNADYAVEKGCTRNQEPWRKEQQESIVERNKREYEEKFLPLKAIENKAVDSKREIDMMETLEQLQAKQRALEHATPSITPVTFDRTVDEDPSDDEVKQILQAAPSTSGKPLFSVLSKHNVTYSRPKLDPKTLGIRIKKAHNI